MKFSYSSKTADGKIEQGTLEAANEAQAAKVLHEKKLFVLELKKDEQGIPGIKKGSITIPLIGKKVSLKDKIVFTQQLAMMVKSGLPLIDAFTSLEEQTENKYFGQILNEIANEVKGGKTLSETLAKYPKVFSKFYVSIVRSGEKSGRLDDVLERLSDQLQKDYDLITKIKAAVTYPILVVVALVGIMIVMLIFVVPQLKTIFADIGAELPLLTRIILGTSDIIRNFWYIFILLIIGIYVGIRFWINNPSGGLTYDKIKLRLPLVGGIIKKLYMARFARTMGTLIASGLPMLDIIDTVKDVLTNKVYQRGFENISKDVESGITLSTSLKKQGIFPPMIYNLIATGEKSGKLDDVLLSMADFFDKEVEASTANLATLIEPILIIIIGAGVGLVVASVLMPIYSLVNAI